MKDVNEVDIFKGVGIEVSLEDQEDFLKIKETLTRIGVSSRKNDTLYQSCHILHKQNRYAIVHFKELFILDGKTATISDSDIQRRNTITKLLEEWGLIKIVDNKKFKLLTFASMGQIKIIPFKNKNEWNLIAKYNIGKK